MTDKEYKQFCEFINKVLYELTTLDDYDIIIRDLGGVIRNRNNDYWTINTICHNIDGGGNNLTFYTEDRVFHCFSECNCSYNLLTLVKQRFKVLGDEKSITQCLKYICERIGIEFNFKVEERKENKNLFNWKSQLLKYTKKGENIRKEKVYNKSILNYFNNIYDESWIEEGISVETLQKYHIKYYDRLNQIVIPCYNNVGNLIGIRIRNMNPDIAERDGKYRPIEMLNGDVYKFPTNDYFYGINYNETEIMKRKTCVLVESEKAVMKSDTWFGNNSIALGMYGHNLTKSKVKQIIKLNVSDLIICMDWDYHDVWEDEKQEKYTKEYEKYVDNVNKIIDRIQPYVKNIYVMVNPNNHNDYYKQNPFDLTKEQYDELWKIKEKI